MIHIFLLDDHPTLRQMLQDPDMLAVDGTATLIYEELTPEALRKAGATQETIRVVQGTKSWPTVQITGPELHDALLDLKIAPIPEY